MQAHCLSFVAKEAPAPQLTNACRNQTAPASGPFLGYKTLITLESFGIIATDAAIRTKIFGSLNWMSRKGNGSSFNGNLILTARRLRLDGAATSNSAGLPHAAPQPSGTRADGEWPAGR